MKRHWPVLGNDYFGVASYLCQPGTKLLSIRNGGREGHYLYVFRKVENHLFPDRSPESVGEVVNLVHHHKSKILESC